MALNIDGDAQGAANGSAEGAVRRIAATPDAVITLPAGTDPAAIVAVGRDLVVTLPDGGKMVIVDGAVFVPTLVIGTVSIPEATLVSLLIGHEPQPAAGPPSSSGGNFAVPVGTLGTSYAIGNLLPPTELAFGTPTVELLDTNVRVRLNALPEVTIGDPLSVDPSNETNSVAEAGLPARGSESPGSNAAAASETATGTILYTGGDAPTGVTLNGVALTGAGQAITTTYGVFTVTAVRDGAIDYSYTLSDNTAGDSTRDTVTVVVTDRDGDSASGTLTVTIVDDVPTAIADVDRVAAPSGPATASTTVAVNLNDAGFWSTVPAGATQVALNGATLSSVNGALAYGGGATVLSPSDGRAGQGYTLEIDAVNDQPEAVRLDFASAQTQVRLTLGQLFRETIVNTVPDAEKVTVIVGLADGTTVTRTVAAVETGAPGDLFVTLSAAEFGGQAIRSVQLTPDLTGPVLPDTLSPADRAVYANLAFSDFVLRAVSYDVAAAPVTAPFADGNVLTGAGGTDANATDGVADIRGADGASVTGVVAGVAASASGNLGTAVAGQFGTLTLAADGGYRYTPSATDATLRALIPGETRTDTFTYTITDGDGDQSTTTLTITIDGADDPVAITGLSPAVTGGDVQVSEANLPGGTAPNAAALTGAGDFAIAAPDGYGTISVAGRTVYSGGAFTPATVTTPLGNTLAITGFDAASGTVRYQYTLNSSNGTGTEGAATDRVTESFAVTATDRNGSAATGTLVATVFDDSPVVNADVDRVAVGSPSGTQTATVVVDYTDPTLFSGLPNGSTSLTVGAVTLDSINGALSYNRGASVLSPSDGRADQGWTQEIDRYNDLPEGVRLTFAQAQSSVRVIVGQLYQEQLFRPQPDAEKVTVLVTLDDNTVATRTITATATQQPGEASVSLNAAEFGGHLITSVALVPDPSTPTLPTGVVIPPAQIQNATTPYSDFVLRGVEYQTTSATPATRSYADGNVLTGTGGTDANTSDGVADQLGADGGRVTAVGAQYDPSTGTVGGATAGSYGTLTLAADGSYTYLLNNDLPGVQRLGANATLTDRFSYTVTDGDGDRATTTLTITIQQPSASGSAPATGATATAITATAASDSQLLSAATVARAAERAAEATATATFASTLVAAATVAAAAAPIAATQTVYQEAVAIGSSAPTATAPAESAHAVATAAPVATAAATESQAAHPAAAALAATSAHAEAAPSIGEAGLHAEPHASAPVDAAESHVAAPPAPALIDTAAIPVAAIAPPPAVAASAPAQVATVLTDALHGGAPAGAASVDQLLSALPTPSNDPGHAPAALAFVPDADHGLAAAWNALAAAQAAATVASAGHDGVTVVAHAA